MTEQPEFLSPSTTCKSITTREARKRLLYAMKQRQRGGFLNFATEPLLDSIEQRDAKNKRRIHPMLVVGGVLLLLAAGAMFFFPHTH